MKAVLKVSDDKWREMLGASPDTNFFSTPAWADVVQRAYGYQKATRLYLFDDGQEVLLPLMLTHKPAGVFSEYVSMPLSGYGGLISSKPVPKDRIVKILDSFGAREAVSLFPNPLSKTSYQSIEGGRDVYTHILFLDADFSKVWETKVNRNRRYEHRRSQALDVEVTTERSLAAFSRYYDIYAKRRRSAVRPTFTRERCSRLSPSNPKRWSDYGWHESTARRLAEASSFMGEQALSIGRNPFYRSTQSITWCPLCFTE